MTAGSGRARHRWIASVGFLALAGAIIGGLIRLEIDTGTASFLPSGDPAEVALAAKADDFGGDAVVVILETGTDRALFNDQAAVKELVGLEGALSGLPDVAAVYGPGTVLNQTAGAAQDMLAQISGRRDGYRQQVIAAARKRGLSKEKARALGKAAVRRFDERYGSLIVRGLPSGFPTLSNPRFIQTVLFDPETLEARPQWRSLVPTANSVTILVRPRADLDAAGTADLVAGVREAVAGADLDLARTTVTGPPVIAAALADRGRSELPLLGAVAIGVVGLIFAAFPWTPRRRSRWRPVASALAGTLVTLAGFGWAGVEPSLGVVAFLPILLGIGSDFPLYLSHGRHDRAALVAAAAAAVGFGSLALSPLPFVRELGVALAIGLTVTVVIALALRWVLGPLPTPAGTSSTRRDAPPTSVRIGVGVALVASAGFGWLALSDLEVEAQPEQLAVGLPELADAERAEEILGSSGEVSLVVRADDVADPEVLAWTREAQRRIVTELGDRVHPVLSLADLLEFLGDDVTPDQVDAAMEVVPRYLSSAVVRSDREAGLITLAVEFDDVADLSMLLDQAEEAVGEPPPGVTVDQAGLPVSAARGLDLVSEGRAWMNLAGITLAGIVILIGLRSWSDAARAVSTVVVATGWVALLAAATAGALSPLTIAIGSLVTATGCEFAVMLRRGERVLPVAVAAAAGTAGYLVLALSELAVLGDFGLLLAGGVVCSFVAALVIDRLVLPSGGIAAEEEVAGDPIAVPAPRVGVSA